MDSDASLGLQRTPGQRPGRRGRPAVCGRPKTPVPGVSVATPPGRGGGHPVLSDHALAEAVQEIEKG